ncbi:hypothetical protein FHS76_002037 [Ochrobactrum daejeonense]|uniref:Uncharacterized protein n=1 Tax=Brucella daejeonensis TaxID=659015 RepID=A0A7W9ELB5_9HYPH|nr:hypothetical protein [Brucella daejeonensis]MBB5702162.1 hypothetical protein [Brucella daejeonensis]
MFGLALVTLIGVGIRIVMMLTLQQRRERMNRQINERLKTLIAAYKTLGGSFTGNLSVDPRHMRDVRMQQQSEPGEGQTVELIMLSERSRRIRDAVEAALSDILLLGTEEHIRLAERAIRELVSGHPIHTHALVVSLRDFIRQALDLDPIPADLQIPEQGPVRQSSAGGRNREGPGGGKGGGGMGGMGGGGMGMGGLALGDETSSSSQRS